jgi:very-short-patch-repair endonuclease
VPSAPSEPRGEVLAQHALERHQRRRQQQGIPTLTVFAGPPGQAMASLRHWAAQRQQPLCVAVSHAEADVVRAWFEEVARGRELRWDAAEFLGTAAGLAPGELRARLEGKSTYESDVLLQELLPAALDVDATAVCLKLLPPRDASAALFEEVLGACGGEASRALAAVRALIPDGAAPVLLLAGTGSEWLARAARTAARLCAAVPSLAIALSVDRPSVDAFLAEGESQAHAMVREGLVDLAGPSPEELKRRLRMLGVQHVEALAESVGRLAEDGASGELVTRFGQAARRSEAAAKDPAEADGARSEAERFMRLLLDEMPDTQGLFDLNTRAEFRINNRPVEVDFLSDRLRIAIEIDGYYHFQGPEAYRRDRRKDLALQRHGYLVLRFLAMDVVERLQEIRNTLREVVAQRRELG